MFGFLETYTKRENLQSHLYPRVLFDSQKAFDVTGTTGCSCKCAGNVIIVAQGNEKKSYKVSHQNEEQYEKVLSKISREMLPRGVVQGEVLPP